jgi:hypothetical protein
MAHSARCWSDRPLRLDAGRRLEYIARIAAACVAYPPPGKEEPQQEWGLSQRVRRKSIVVREVEHVRNEAAGSSLTVASAPEIGLCALCSHGSVGSIVDGGWYVSCCNSSSTCSARSGVIAVISTSCSRRMIVRAA